MQKRPKTKEKVILIIGLLFIAAGVLLNEWLLTALFSSDGVIAGHNRILIWIFDLCCICIGLIVLMSRGTLTKCKKIGGYTIYILLLLFITEGGLRLFYHYQFFPDPVTIIFYWHQYGQIKGLPELASYIRFRPSSEHGELNRNGFHSPEIMPKKDQFRIIFIGGSTTFDFGPIEETYPHLVYQILKMHNKNLDYINAGCPGYTSTESLISYHLQLKSFRPDLIILYNARNDMVVSANEYYTPNITNLRPYPMIIPPSPLHRSLSKASLIFAGFSEALGIEAARHKVPWLINMEAATKTYGMPGNVDRFMENLNKGAVFEVYKNNIEAFALLTSQRETSLVLVGFDFVPERIKSKAVPKDRPFESHELRTMDITIKRLNHIMQEVSLKYKNVHFFDLNMKIDREYFMDDSHLNLDGKKQKADLIANFILSIRNQIGFP